jgi:thioredoxin family protein
MSSILCLLFLSAWPQLTGARAAAPERLFEQGQTIKQFVNGARVQRDLWLKNTSEASAAPGLVDRLKRVGRGLRLLVVAEDWCPDSVNTVPYIAMLAASAEIPLRIVDRTAGEPIMKRHHAPDGRAVTPLVVFLRDGREVGAWVERPAALQQLFLSMATNADAAERFANKQAWYDADGGGMTLAEIVALAETTAERK